MSSIKVATSYKKKDGFLEYDSAKKNILWTPTTPGGPISLPLASVTNLKQTPATSEKVALRVEAGADNYTFAFTSPNAARVEQEAITDVLRKEIQTRNAKSTPAAQNGTPVPRVDGDGPSASMAIAQAVRSGTNVANNWSDDKRLVMNLALQESLLKDNRELRQLFEQSLADRPEDITPAQLGAQFWSNRIHLLRAYAFEKSQTQGAYNVLAQLKETNVDGARKLNLTREHIQALFKQHPIVKHIYNEVVPNKFTESEFWARFFVSRLLRKLKGQRITDDCSTDAVLDKYLDTDELSLRNKQIAESHIPRFIDLEGNEENHSQRRGNRPDTSMIPEYSGKAPILGILNNMSERMLQNVAPADGAAHAPVGTDESTYNELRLRDLQAEQAQERVVLDVNSERRMMRNEASKGVSSVAQRYARQDPAGILKSLRRNISQPVVLGAASSTASEDNALAVAQIVSLIQQQNALSSTAASKSNLSEETMRSLLLTHNTTMEFLHYFWTVFTSATSGAPLSTRRELTSLHATLAKSVERIAAVADGAEKERQGQIVELKRAAREYFEKTGKKRGWEESKVTLGGGKEVNTIMAPTLKAIKVAGEKFELLMKQ